MTDPKTTDEAETSVLFGWNKSELLTLGIAVAILAVWGGSFALFGFSALITVGLLLVFASFAALIMISRGD
ncbi:hypothetical protein [Meridianimarinicoccus aquatilis]|uniref:Uncharacterized protein n=1 Tax=Meridianimarinicoccus aquatilis TaxID=2552766 RepID=A0A4R6B5I1_9RHOB|nr:hypothetical protein [Fluviibacterium aquatile]QIE42405.1 hypothetical protein G5B39_10975 [Rhodobacteraceae bacterium SC52]TDL91196.1 hypothetical protein E2L05_01030 [Fluviibacterium aquatile]